MAVIAPTARTHDWICDTLVSGFDVPRLRRGHIPLRQLPAHADGGNSHTREGTKRGEAAAPEILTATAALEPSLAARAWGRGPFRSTGQTLRW
jgi:hypothetical protein